MLNLNSVETHSMQVKFQLKAAGYCIAGQHHALRGTARKDIRFYATFGIIQHPKLGVILFDTGYTSRFYEETKNFPTSIYARVTKVSLKPEEEAHRILLSQGIKPEEVRYIIISHFHSDHVGGLRDFPKAKFICAENAYLHYKKSQGVFAFRKGYLNNLLPDDFEERVEFIDWKNKGSQDPTLGEVVDYFGDGSIRFCRLEGHARGQIGAVLQTQTQEIFLVADACWMKQTYQKGHLPHPIVRTFFDSWSAFKASLRKVQNYHEAKPESLIIPCHCEETMREVEGKVY